MGVEDEAAMAMSMEMEESFMDGEQFADSINDGVLRTPIRMELQMSWPLRLRARSAANSFLKMITM